MKGPIGGGVGEQLAADGLHPDLLLGASETDTQ
jgi:hypothetical protein